IACEHRDRELRPRGVLGRIEALVARRIAHGEKRDRVVLRGAESFAHRREERLACGSLLRGRAATSEEPEEELEPRGVVLRRLEEPLCELSPCLDPLRLVEERERLERRARSRSTKAARLPARRIEKRHH